jgi:hypothetical protein
MEVLGHWRRGALGAAGATVVAPLAVILGALAVGILGGGLKGLGTLGQALDGPDLPITVAEAPTKARRKAGNERSRLLARAQTARQRRNVAPARPVADPSPRADQPTRRSPSAPAPGSGGNGTPPPAGGSDPAAPSTPPPPATPAPSASPQPSLVRQTGDVVKGVVQQAPVVGDTGAGVVEDVVSTVDGLCPPPVCPQK